MTKSSIRSGVQTVVLLLGLLVVVVGPILLIVAPWRPSSLVGWIFFVILAIPAYAALEGVGGWFMDLSQSHGLGKTIGQKTAGQSFAWLRVLYALRVMLVWLSLCYGVVYLFHRIV